MTKQLFKRAGHIIFNMDGTIHFQGEYINQAKRESRKLVEQHGLGSVRLS